MEIVSVATGGSSWLEAKSYITQALHANAGYERLFAPAAGVGSSGASLPASHSGTAFGL